LNHQVRGHGPVREVAYPAQIGAALGGQGLDHAHRRLDDRVLDAEEGLDSILQRRNTAGLEEH